MKNTICEGCNHECKDNEICNALRTLYKLYDDLKTGVKEEIVKNLRKELNLIDYETSEELRSLGESVIKAFPEELRTIVDFDVKIGYVLSYEAKKDKGKAIAADCRKVTGTYTAYLPFDFIITFYEPNMYYMTKNQKQILMLHELKHIGIGERGLRVEPHNIEDFESILRRFGLSWNHNGNDVPDITAGGEGDTKGNKLETKSKTNSNGRTPTKSRGQKNKN